MQKFKFSIGLWSILMNLDLKIAKSDYFEIPAIDKFSRLFQTVIEQARYLRRESCRFLPKHISVIS